MLAAHPTGSVSPTGGGAVPRQMGKDIERIEVLELRLLGHLLKEHSP